MYKTTPELRTPWNQDSYLGLQMVSAVKGFHCSIAYIQWLHYYIYFIQHDYVYIYCLGAPGNKLKMRDIVRKACEEAEIYKRNQLVTWIIEATPILINHAV